MEIPKKARFGFSWALCVILGAIYGLIMRGFFGNSRGNSVFETMSLTFIFGVPVALGFVTIAFADLETRESWPRCVVIPWLSGVLYVGSALLFLWEGLICAIIWLPIVLVLSSIGGILAGIMHRIIKSGRGRNYCVAIVALLPLVAAPLEHLRASRSEIRAVRTQIKIHASPQTVWSQIRTVPLITEREQFFSFSHLMGFPRPLEAKLVGEGVGAVRYATFERGVLFVETITQWDELHQLAFSIRADTEHIPPTTFDEHVTIGGEYFDVLRGNYWLEPVGNGDVILHLSSEQRLSTRFNFYSHWWTEYLMADLQNYILEIIKRRCETQKT